ncbi:Condensation domain-containing protein [Micromonospora pallida]|uniref:Condensation domain-containing protein n=1 Tax=Micromonospora pallida TaxID=145854 RepID=A0A1C6SBF0_9ACTN|nr:condensation domain-containing protein [Micromonospora pallida]SCL26661.1 Condensation domain-containing protein [Micromonospora pallida]
MLISQSVRQIGASSEEVTYADFHGGRAATGPLTWGQRAMWRTVAEFASVQHSFLNLRRVLAVSARAGVDPARAVGALAALVGRHESLRTRVHPTDGDLRQVAAAEGRLPVLVHTAPGADPDGQETAGTLAARLGAPRFDHAVEWPLRAALVVVDGLVRQIVVVFSHSTVDFHATETVLRDLRMLLLRGVVPTPPGLQSLDVAERERQAERRRSDRAVAYWLRQFPALGAGRFAARAVPAPTPRYRQGALTSAAIHHAVRVLAARHGVSSSTVLLAATAAALSADGPEVCGIVTMANNRFQPAYDTAISKLNQIGLCRVDLTGRPDFAALLRRTRQASLDAYRHAYYDPIAMARAFAEHGYDHGTGFAPFCYLNDIRLPHDVSTSTVGALRAAPAGGFRWVEDLERFAWRCRIQVVDAPGAVELVVTADTAYLPAEQAERLLRAIEDRLVEAALSGR